MLQEKAKAAAELLNTKASAAPFQLPNAVGTFLFGLPVFNFMQYRNKIFL
jgi:hypothetical protein